MKAIYTPTIPGSKSNIWMFETIDTAQHVKAFHAKKHQGAWKLLRAFPFLTLQKNNKEIVINVTELEKTLVTYELRKVNN